MSHSEALAKYPEFHRLFAHSITRLHHESGPMHPLLTLILSTGDRSIGLVTRMNSALRRIAVKHGKWLDERVTYIVEQSDFTNVRAALGEIRALGELLIISPNGIATSVGGGCDFRMTVGSHLIDIEVHTPQPRSDPKRTTIVHPSGTPTGRIRITIEEHAPFGLPRRANENVQGEVVARLASIKGDERQFGASSINVLWIDLNDFGTFPGSIAGDQAEPLIAWNGNITSGALWAAFYGHKKMPVFEGLNVAGPSRRTYFMEFDGRFAKKSKIDFAITDFLDDQVVYQNPLGRPRIPREVFVVLHELNKLNLARSWINWPSPNLRGRVRSQLATIRRYGSSLGRYTH